MQQCYSNFKVSLFLKVFTRGEKTPQQNHTTSVIFLKGETMIFQKGLRLFPLRSSYCLACRLKHTENPVRVRFAPSPTGQLHLGGLRTALYNYMFAKKQDGKFILRIEDTDQTRLVPGAMEKLIGMLSWAGIEADESPFQGGEYGPYIQSKRISLYWEHIQTLLENGSAYYCFCTQKRLELLKKEQTRRRENSRYDNRCRHLTNKEVEDKLHSSVPYVIRFKLDHFTEPWNDLVYGPTLYDAATSEGDFVLLKSDRFPTYHFANVVDDHLMKISHVLRGVEWQVSTTKHLLLYKAFGWEPPRFGHLPLLLNKDGTKLSKRQNDIHVDYLKSSGYFPESVISFLTTMGSGFETNDTVGLSLEELTEQFDLSKVRTNSTRIDNEKLPILNRMYIRKHMNENEEKKKELVMKLRNIVIEHYSKSNRNLQSLEELLTEKYIESVLQWAKERIFTLEDLVTKEYDFLWNISNSEKLEELSNNVKFVPEALELTHRKLGKLDKFDAENVRQCLKQCCKEMEMKTAVFMKTLRVGISGLGTGPPVAEIVTILGKEHTLQRLHYSLEIVEKFVPKKIDTDQ